MKLLTTEINGVFEISLEKKLDSRGYFARFFCERTFAEKGLDFRPVQLSLSGNESVNTLRGLHYQTAPSKEAKLVTVVRGAIYDVVLDLRTDSPTFKKWLYRELTDDKHNMLYVPPGCAHGFCTLRTNTEVLYLMNEFYQPEWDRAVRWNDPAFQIRWPIKTPAAISEKDRDLPDYK